MINLLPASYRRSNALKIGRKIMLEGLLGASLIILVMNLSLTLQHKIMQFELTQIEGKLQSKQYVDFSQLEENIQEKIAYITFLENEVAATSKSEINFVACMDSLLSLSNRTIQIKALNMNTSNNRIELEGVAAYYKDFFEYFKAIQRSYLKYQTYFYLEPMQKDEPVTFFISIYPREEQSVIDEEAVL